MPPSGKPPVPQKPWEGLTFKPGKKAVLGIIVVIIIVAVVLGAFFLYPMISNSEGVTPYNATALTTVPTIIKNSGTAVFSTKTLNPTATATYRPTPGCSGARVGL
jgi:flagellar basal body-associated protein FliL